ncbi:GPCR kinase, partial [Tanacetum coccineum]
AYSATLLFVSHGYAFVQNNELSCPTLYSLVWPRLQAPFGGTVTGCLGDVDNFLKNGKLEQVVGIVKSSSPNMLDDLNVTLKDLSGTILGTIHHKVIGKGGYGKDIVSVFSPNPLKHYLNIMRNVVEVFRKDFVLENGSG